MKMDTAKAWIKDLVEICAIKGLEHAVISPGSRSAPLVISFSRHPNFKCHTLIDERSAAFFAMGMAQQLQKPAALICTSGSALLNYAPAMAEAFYQKIPLLVLSADRPGEYIDQADGQTMRQFDAYHNFVKKSYQLPVDGAHEDDRWHINRIISEAINLTMSPAMGPVHINIPFREPLYDLQEYGNYQPPKTIEISQTFSMLNDSEKEQLIKSWNSYSKKLIIAGSSEPDGAVAESMKEIAKDPSVAILSETTSNLHCPGTIKCIDPALERMPVDKRTDYQPGLLVTFGGDIVSKKIKAFLRKNRPVEHWRIDPSKEHVDTFQSLTKIIGIEAKDFFKSVSTSGKPVESEYAAIWKKLSLEANDFQHNLLSKTPYCDFTVMKELMEQIPPHSNLHFANSTPVRYSNLFEIDTTRQIKVNSNRGVSGIEGSVSTAAGAAEVNGKLTTIITGDLGFFYDMHALWNKKLSPNLRIIILNNSGGNIFRIIPGPSDLEELENFFETRQDQNAEQIAKAYQIPYYFCHDFESLRNHLNTFFHPKDKAAILEIKTPGDVSAEVMKEYLFKR